MLINYTKLVIYRFKSNNGEVLSSVSVHQFKWKWKLLASYDCVMTTGACLQQFYAKITNSPNSKCCTAANRNAWHIKTLCSKSLRGWHTTVTFTTSQYSVSIKNSPVYRLQRFRPTLTKRTYLAFVLTSLGRMLLIDPQWIHGWSFEMHKTTEALDISQEFLNLSTAEQWGVLGQDF